MSRFKINTFYDDTLLKINDIATTSAVMRQQHNDHQLNIAFPPLQFNKNGNVQSVHLMKICTCPHLSLLFILSWHDTCQMGCIHVTYDLLDLFFFTYLQKTCSHVTHVLE